MNRPMERCNVCSIWVWDGDGYDTGTGTTCHDCHTHDPAPTWGDDPVKELAEMPQPSMTERTRDHLTGHVLILLVWLFYFGGAVLQELGCGG